MYLTYIIRFVFIRLALFLSCVFLFLLQCDDLERREVTQDEIEDMCKEHDFLGWSETSVKDGIMIEESMG